MVRGRNSRKHERGVEEERANERGRMRKIKRVTPRHG